jgi:anti-sigma-K factor RskA
VRCSEFKESAWAYALGTLEANERAELDRHLAEPIAHEGCRAELDRAFRTTSAISDMAPAVQPPADAWSKIESRIASEGQAKVLPMRRKGWAPFVAAFAAAAAAAFVVLFAKAWTYRNAVIEKNEQLSRMSGVVTERDACRQELEAMRQSSEMQRAALALLELPATRLVPLTGSQTPSRGNALLNMEQQKALVLITALAPTVGKDYELWVIRKGSPPVPAGILKPGRDGKVIAEVKPELLRAGRPDTFAVTVEPLGGSPAPTTDPFLIGDVQAG